MEQSDVDQDKGEKKVKPGGVSLVIPAIPSKCPRACQPLVYLQLMPHPPLCAIQSMGNVYTVVVGKPLSCDCPDSLKKGTCKVRFVEAHTRDVMCETDTVLLRFAAHHLCYAQGPGVLSRYLTSETMHTPK